jgi:hypothetical protein
VIVRTTPISYSGLAAIAFVGGAFAAAIAALIRLFA